MTEIPSDVMDEAVLAFNTAIEMDGYEGSYEVIARAILAERERWSAEIKRLTSESSPYMIGFEDGWEAGIGEPRENNS